MTELNNFIGIFGDQSVESTRSRDVNESTETADCVADVLGSAFLRGITDYKNGVVVGDNPYKEHDAKHWEWLQGWATAGASKI